MDEFKNYIKKVFSTINSPISIVYKINEINNMKKYFCLKKHENILDRYYEFIKGNKEKGIIYTPFEICDYIIENTIKEEYIIKNPFLKILDPACGCGNIIIRCFYYLKKIYINNLKLINKKNNINLKAQDIERHIIENNLYGYDLDELSVMILCIELFNITHLYNFKNFKCKDFLLDKIEEKYDVCLGNPPYIGHKSVNKQYSKIIKNMYPNIYKDKSDISYCFFIKSIEILNKNGKVTFITSRYFLESKSGKSLRVELTCKTCISKIVDFYGIRPFEGASVDPVIIFLQNKQCKSYDVNVIKPLKIYNQKFFFKNKKMCNMFNVNSKELKEEGWILIDDFKKKIINKIRKKCTYRLRDICDSYQGIITGCDKAFIVTDEIIKNFNLDKDIIKPWIKSSNITKPYKIKDKKYIIYSNNIDDEKKYFKTIKYIYKFKYKLEQRRECLKGIRRWYHLQWGRKKGVFEQVKIIFPYKCDKNVFCLDVENNYFSADIYCLIVKKSVGFNYKNLINILNSKLYEVYFKSFAKKLGGKLYEYYPNKLMDLYIPFLKIETERDLYEYFDLSKKEIEYIENIL